ncbi:hypothetical protein, partial [Saccharomonospora saliphila]|uniref:hypothetical protein n=1 Tax=Saccharomonospora saliphila TaxID=369829 RepID=UPI001E54ECD8
LPCRAGSARAGGAGHSRAMARRDARPVFSGYRVRWGYVSSSVPVDGFPSDRARRRTTQDYRP